MQENVMAKIILNALVRFMYHCYKKLIRRYYRSICSLVSTNQLTSVRKRNNKASNEIYFSQIHFISCNKFNLFIASTVISFAFNIQITTPDKRNSDLR